MYLNRILTAGGDIQRIGVIGIPVRFTFHHRHVSCRTLLYAERSYNIFDLSAGLQELPAVCRPMQSRHGKKDPPTIETSGGTKQAGVTSEEASTKSTTEGVPTGSSPKAVIPDCRVGASADGLEGFRRFAYTARRFQHGIVLIQHRTRNNTASGQITKMPVLEVTADAAYVYVTSPEYVGWPPAG
ncbi:MAG: hypothetical protein ABIZ80_20510 [Bryobacteraceae bacterium]